MWKRATRLCSLCSVILICAPACSSAKRTSVTATQDADKPRVGTFNRTALLVAYYKSKTHADWLDDLERKREEALAAGQTERAKEIERQGRESQELAHRQLAGEAPLTNILDHLQASWSSIANKAGVQAIIEHPLRKDPSVKFVDVTSLLVEQMESTKKGHYGP